MTFHSVQMIFNCPREKRKMVSMMILSPATNRKGITKACSFLHGLNPSFLTKLMRILNFSTRYEQKILPPSSKTEAAMKKINALILMDGIQPCCEARIIPEAMSR